MITFIPRNVGLPLGGTPSVVGKDGESRAEGTGVPGGASKRPEKASRMVENAPPHLNPQIPPNPYGKRPLPPPRCCDKKP